MTSNQINADALGDNAVVVDNGVLKIYNPTTKELLAKMGDDGTTAATIFNCGVNGGVIFGENASDAPTRGFQFVKVGGQLTIYSQVLGTPILDDEGTFYDGAGNILIDPQNGPIMMSAVCNSGQSIPNSADTTVIFNSVEHVSHFTYDNTTGIATCIIPGWYEVAGHIGVGITAANSSAVRIAKNGATVCTTQLNASSNNATLSVRKIIQLAAGDTVSIVAWQNSGGAWNITTQSWFQINKIQ